MLPKDRLDRYVEWLAHTRGISIGEARTIATTPKPCRYPPAAREPAQRRDNIVRCARPASVVDIYLARYDRLYQPGSTPDLEVIPAWKARP